MRISPVSGVSRPFTTTMPSSSGTTTSQRLRRRSRSRAASSWRVPFFQARTIRSTRATVRPAASSTSSASCSGVATRVRARTWP
jgi:hypothetical protein